MNDIDRLILMAKFAVYDKKTGERDRKINEFFLNDYVYYKNCWTRLYALLGSLIVLFIFWLHRIVIDGLDIFAIDYKQALTDSILFIVVVMVAYTMIGTAKATYEYNQAQRRLKRYFMLLNRLDRSAHEANAEEASNNGAGFVG